MALRVFTLVLAALGTAAAFPATSEACFSKDKFTLSMHFKDETLHLTAVDSGQSGTGRSTGRSVNLVGLCDYSGTPVCQSGTSPNASLALEVGPNEPLTNSTGIFHISVPDVGGLHGAAFSIMGFENGDYPHFYASDDSIQPQMTSGAQMWLACERSILDKKQVGLSWGSAYSNGSMPWGCAYTSVKKVFNVEVPCDS